MPPRGSALPYARIRPMRKLVDSLLKQLQDPARWVALTGAGVSAASGIPTYRDHSGLWLGSQPIQHQEFIEDPSKRRRYWSRSVFGWPRVGQASPNTTHEAIAKLETCGVFSGVITQNVDRLHQSAGSHNVIDLHGRLDEVRCLSCRSITSRTEIQEWLETHNTLPEAASLQLRPDGDAELPLQWEQGFQVPECYECGGIMKPEVVFFGGSVPAERVEACYRLIDAADGLVVIGTSLTVYSGFRFCRYAYQQGKPLIILNEGETRADPLSRHRCDNNPFGVLIECANTLASHHAEDCHV